MVFFLTKCITISTACKGMERNNASMIMQSEDKALLSVRQLLLNLMGLHTVKTCYKGNLWPSLETTLFSQLYLRGVSMLYVHTTFHETFHLHLHHGALHLQCQTCGDAWVCTATYATCMAPGPRPRCSLTGRGQAKNELACL